jgi:hypothetical protein
MRDQANSLRESGYSLVIGLRDVYPQTAAELPVLRPRIDGLLPSSPPNFSMVFAVHEIESWFIQEASHFGRIHNDCTMEKIFLATGYNIDLGVAEGVFKPSKLLHDAYKVGGRAYRKNKKYVVRTVDAIDYAHLYLNCRAMLTSFDEFVGLIETEI